MIEFPRLVYRAEGKYVRPGGTYDFTGVSTQEEYNQKLSDGWFDSIESATEEKHAVSKPVKADSDPVLDDSAPPTREELETKATELGIKFDGRFSDKKIAQLIDEALKN
jgi:hypothetical protein